MPAIAGINLVHKAAGLAGLIITGGKKRRVRTVSYTHLLESSGNQAGTGQDNQKAVAFSIPDHRVTPYSNVAALQKVNGAWQEETTVAGNGYVIVLGVKSTSPFTLVADPSTLAIPDPPAVCTYQPQNAQVQGGVLRAEVSATGILTATYLAQALAESGAADIGTAVAIDLTGQRAAFDECALTLTKEACQKLAESGVRRLDIETRQFALSLDAQALQTLYDAQNDVTICVDKADQSQITAGARKALDGLYKLSILDGNQALAGLNQGAMTLSLPYTPAKGEAQMAAVGADGLARPLLFTGASAEQKRVHGWIRDIGLYGVMTVQTPAYEDIDGHWASGDVTFAAGRGLLTGTAEDQFSPDMTMTRGMLIAVLHRLAGSPQAVSEGIAFTDISADSYYADAVAWAVEAGILSDQAAILSPEQPVTRQETAVLWQSFARYMGIDLPKAYDAAIFADDAAITGWARDAVRDMQMAGVMSGRADGSFIPQGTLTRAEAAAVLHRFITATMGT